MPLISVIIPTYNRSNLILRSVKSVLLQQQEDFELLIIDDGSTDDTKKVVSTCNDPRLRYYYKENGGVSSARNLGLDHAKGEYITFLDDDDEWQENFLTEMVKALEKSPPSAVAYAQWRINGSGYVYPTIERPSGKLTTPLFTKGFTSFIASLFRAQAIQGMRFDSNLRIAEDSDFFLRVSLIGEFIYVDSTCSIQNSTGESLTSNFDESRILSLERFYFKLGAKDIIPERIAMKKLSKSSRSVAKYHVTRRNIKAANYYFRKAIKYRPSDLRNYLPFLKTAVQAMWAPSTWEPPKALPEKISSE